MIPWLLVIELMSHRGVALADLVESRRTAFPSSGEMNFRVDDVPSAIARVEATYAPAVISRYDTGGLSLAFDTWRFNLRASNSEPLLRLNVEVRGDAALLTGQVARIRNLIADDQWSPFWVDSNRKWAQFAVTATTTPQGTAFVNPKTRHRLALTGSFSFAATILWLTLTPQELPESGTLPLDKLAHLGAFAAYVLPTAVFYRPALISILVVGVVLAGSIELIQPFVGRNGEWPDSWADLLGLGLGAATGLGLG